MGTACAMLVATAETKNYSMKISPWCLLVRHSLCAVCPAHWRAPWTTWMLTSAVLSPHPRLPVRLCPLSPTRPHPKELTVPRAAPGTTGPCFGTGAPRERRGRTGQMPAGLATSPFPELRGPAARRQRGGSPALPVTAAAWPPEGDR